VLATIFHRPDGRWYSDAAVDRQDGVREGRLLNLCSAARADGRHTASGDLNVVDVGGESDVECDDVKEPVAWTYGALAVGDAT